MANSGRREHIMAASITLLHAPHAEFTSKAALDEFRDDAIATEQAIKLFREDGCDSGLWSDLSALGWPGSEIERVIANPWASFDCLYQCAGDAW
jgi:hypothetical protein